MENFPPKEFDTGNKEVAKNEQCLQLIKFGTNNFAMEKSLVQIFLNLGIL